MPGTKLALDHVALEVRDLFAMELFYRKAFGFRPTYHYVSRNTPGLRTVFLERDGLSLELLERPRVEAPGRPAPGGHLALAVADVDGEFARLAALDLPGVRLVPPRVTGDGYREAALHDPEGNVVELVRRVRPPPAPPLRAAILGVDGTLLGTALATARTAAFPGLVRFLHLLRAEGWPVAVASGAPPEVLRRLVAAAGIASHVVAVVSAEEVPRGKPAPDVFLEAARRLAVPPQECLVVEDSRDGVEAARRAFMRCIAAPDPTEPPPADVFLMADLLLEGGMSFDADRALAWAKSAPPP